MKGRITHSVFFRLKHKAGSVEETIFLDACRRVLKPIPGVESFRVLKQTSVKNNFHFGLTMDFENQSAYDGYNDHPEHIGFVKETWLPEVKEFMEIDFVDLL